MIGFLTVLLEQEESYYVKEEIYKYNPEFNIQINRSHEFSYL